MVRQAKIMETESVVAAGRAHGMSWAFAEWVVLVLHAKGRSNHAYVDRCVVRDGFHGLSDYVAAARRGSRDHACIGGVGPDG